MLTKTKNINTARIFGLCRHRLTTDGAGVTTLVAFSGCPLRCKYCLNKVSWEPERGRLYTAEQLFEEVKIDQLYFLATHGGVTFGGGEPLLQVEFIKEFRSICGPQWRIVAETSLHVPSEKVEALDPVMDGYIVDIKDLNPDIYRAYTGKDNAVVLKNLEWLLQHGDANRIEVRVPHIPDHNTDEDVERSIESLRTMGVAHLEEFQYIIR